MQGAWTRVSRSISIAALALALNVALVSRLSGQDFRYESKPRADLTGLPYASPDPAPQAMAPSESTVYSYSPPQRAVIVNSPSAVPNGAWPTAPLPQPYSSDTRYYQPPPAQIPPGYTVVQPGAAAPGVYSSTVVSAPPCEQCDPYGVGAMPGSVNNCPGWESPCPAYLEDNWVTGTWHDVEDWCASSPIFAPAIWRNFSEFGGVQGFKGSVDLGVNGDFGFYKGLNNAWPVFDRWKIGYQLGGEIVVSDLSGSSGPLGTTREQYFVTTGFFRRATLNQGFQGGVVLDYLHDNFYVKMDLLQIRPDISYVVCGGHEFGFWGAISLKSETKTAPAFVGTPTVTWQAVDQYNFYYRRTFAAGGYGRTWVGFTEQGDVMFGSDTTIPLAEQWGIQGAYNYLLPTGNNPVPANTRETWGISLCLVWYPHCKVPNVCFNPYRPLFNVADNSSFMIRTK